MNYRARTLLLTTSSMALLAGVAAYAAPSYVVDATSPSVIISGTLTNSSDHAVFINNGSTPVSVTLTSTSSITGGSITSSSVYIAESSQELILTQAPSATITGNNGAPAAADTPGDNGSRGLEVRGLSTTLNLQGSITGGAGGLGGHGSAGNGQGGGGGGRSRVESICGLYR